ncbi:MAG: acyl-CoA synthetase [Anaerolineales bacterium]|nr:acyl-CoA synthetase [Anaerolineales bacterium]
MEQNPYTLGLDKNGANYVPLSPLTFIERAAAVYPQKTAVIHGHRRYTWAESYTRCRQLASALAQRGIGVGDTVSIMGFNTPETFEAHFGVPMTGAVLHAINTRLDAKTIAFMLGHANSKLLLTDREASATISEALRLLEDEGGKRPFVIDINDPLADGGDLIGDIEYENFIAASDPNFAWSLPADEWQAISLNYTSGTTGNPKGVVYHHRGAYLNAIGNVLAWGMGKHPVYLWTLPMFHCNGWCFPWTLAAMSGTNVCLRKVDPHKIYELIAQEHVTHYCGAPIVHSLLVNAPADVRAQKQHPVKGMVAAAPPPAAVLRAMAENEFDITHVYGLTETYGPAVLCEWHDEWSDLPIENQAQMKARQGVRYHVLEGVMVGHPETLEPVPADGQTIGEVFMRGNNVMMGYLKNEKATNEAFAGGWFHSGDLGVMHPDGYVELKDRSKDIIISGGENISTIEVENALFRHPAVLDAAVVGMPDEKWGETPCAFITLRPGHEATSASDIIAFCREELAHYKVPRHVVFGELPKTSTGKTQKFVLRERVQKEEEK